MASPTQSPQAVPIPAIATTEGVGGPSGVVETETVARARRTTIAEDARARLERERAERARLAAYIQLQHPCKDVYSGLRPTTTAAAPNGNILDASTASRPNVSSSAARTRRARSTRPSGRPAGTGRSKSHDSWRVSDSRHENFSNVSRNHSFVRSAPARRPRGRCASSRRAVVARHTRSRVDAHVVDARDRVGGDGDDGDAGEDDGDAREVWDDDDDEDAREGGDEGRATGRGGDDVAGERDRGGIGAKRIEGAKGGDDGEVGGGERGGKRRMVAERGGDDFGDAAGRGAERAGSSRELVFRVHRKRRRRVRRWVHPGVARARASS